MGKKLEEKQKEYMQQVGYRIRVCRQAKGLSQAELARLVGYEGRSAVNKIEAGQRNVTMALISKFAQILNTTPAYLMGWTKKSTQDSSTLTEIFSLLEKMTDDEQKVVLDIIKSLNKN